VPSQASTTSSSNPAIGPDGGSGSAVSVSAKFMSISNIVERYDTDARRWCFFIIIVVCVVHVHYLALPQCKSLLEPSFSERSRAGSLQPESAFVLLGCPRSKT
jgi:hypothetical protein